MDCYSRRIVGRAIADHLRAELVVDALEMAVARRRPDAGLVHHGDQGSQYTSLVFTRRCRAAGIDLSMGSRGDCFDNAVLRASTRTSRTTSSTANRGRPTPRRAPRRSTTSKRSTTAGAVT
jgi:transposase InsO family protein